ncbi:MAG: hypothetical protein ACL93V_03375 [Candidatus Electrothrix sp. YB6]
MKKVTIFLFLAISAMILSGCYVSPYHYRNYRPYAKAKGYRCPPPMKIDKKAEYKPECETECEECEPEYKPVCRPTCVYSP